MEFDMDLLYCVVDKKEVVHQNLTGQTPLSLCIF